MIKPDSNALLDDIATTLKNFPEWRLKIAGHTDSTGNAAYNEILSMNRANAIKQALVDRGIDAARLETLGMGEKQPVGSNDTPQGQALNRRVELVRLDGNPTSSSSWVMTSAGSTSAPTTGASCRARRRTSTSWPRKA